MKIIPLNPYEKNIHIAHIRKESIQTVAEHLQEVSHLCNQHAAKFGLSHCGQLAGYLHDIGKLSDAFGDYISSQNKNPSRQKGPDHSTAGAVWLVSQLTPQSSKMEQLTAQLIALVVMSHHGGLQDVFDTEGASPYLKRLAKLQTDATWQAQYAQVLERLPTAVPLDRFPALFGQATAEVRQALQALKQYGVSNQQSAGMLCKMLFSALIDADRTDTACFMDNLAVPATADCAPLWSTLCCRLESQVAAFPKTPAINQLRAEISQNCYQNAISGSGIYTLNCPTGSGKTFAALRFALHHAEQHRKQRIVFVLPYLTILEQNVLAIRDVLADGQADAWLMSQILELHSAKEPEHSTDDLSETQLQYAELTSERLASPMIFISMVRFLNTIFASGTKNMRGLHQFCNSILIFDEIQTLSLQHIGLFNTAINFLTTICHATVVLSTATQPVLDGDFHGVIPPLRMAPAPEISGCDATLRQAFRRTQLVDDTHLAGDAPSIAQFVWDLQRAQQDVLVVLNTKSAVRQLYEAMQALRRANDTTPIYLLSTNLYPAHRKRIIAQIKQKLGTTPLIVISTQLIEAGVDISFHTVVRALAGLDSLIQAAGRCNRHGLYALGQVHIIQPDFENLQYLPDIKAGRDIMGELLRIYHKNAHQFPNGLDGQAAIVAYFTRYHAKREAQLTYPVTAESGVLELYELLGKNGVTLRDAKSNLGTQYRPQLLNQSFKTAARYFRAIDDFGTAVIVAHEQAIPLLEQALSCSGIGERSSILRKLQQYTVNLSCYDQQKIGNGLHYHEMLGAYALDASYYDQTFGVSTTQLELPFLGY